jgi:ATP-dependent Clp protease adaptor protein ClpS
MLLSDAVSATPVSPPCSLFVHSNDVAADADRARAARVVGGVCPVIAMAKEPRKDGGNGEDGRGTGTAVITRPRTQTRRPGMYRVLLLNDDYTPMEFVVAVLRKYFSKGPEEATQIMLHVHQHGVGECGVFTYEVAETKVTQVMDYARKHQHPLQCIMEKK